MDGFQNMTGKYFSFWKYRESGSLTNSGSQCELSRGGLNHYCKSPVQPRYLESRSAKILLLLQLGRSRTVGAQVIKLHHSPCTACVYCGCGTFSSFSESPSKIPYSIATRKISTYHALTVIPEYKRSYNTLLGCYDHIPS